MINEENEEKLRKLKKKSLLEKATKEISKVVNLKRKELGQ
jgi:hypothetical protein